MILGVLKEASPERRVAITPDTVKSIKAKGVDVLVEKGAGLQALYADEIFADAGAELVERDQLLGSADVIAFVNAPELAEIQQLSSSKVLIGAMNPFFDKALVSQLVSQKLTSFSMELVPRTTRAQAMDILSSMATIAGYRAVLDAARYLPKFFPMFMSAAGTIKPAKVLILGAGVAGLQAVAIARKLGAVVEVFDVRSAVKEEVMSLGGKFIEVEGAVEDKAAGGYAVEQTDEYKQKQGEMVQKHAAMADVVICTAQIPGRKAPILVKKETVEQMKAGSVILDLAASTGGNCELTEDKNTIDHQGVAIIGESA